MAIVRNTTDQKLGIDDFWTKARYVIGPFETREILDNLYVTSQRIQEYLDTGILVEVEAPKFQSKKIGDWWGREVTVTGGQISVTGGLDVGRSLEYPNQDTHIATDNEGRIVTNDDPLLGTNPRIEFRYNRRGQIVQISYRIDGSERIQNVTGTDITDATVTRVRTFHPFVSA